MFGKYSGQYITHSKFSSVQSLSRVWLFVTPWIAALQASLSITSCQSSPKLMSIESVMPSRHLILCRPLLLLPPIPPIIRVFSNESSLHMRWPKYWSFSFSISPSKQFSKGTRGLRCGMCPVPVTREVSSTAGHSVTIPQRVFSSPCFNFMPTKTAFWLLVCFNNKLEN